MNDSTDGHVSLSVVMPAYNEEESIEDAVKDVVVNILNHIPQAELIVIDDGSTDTTPVLLEKLMQKDSRVRAYRKSNGGHGPAIISGLSHAKGELVFLVDSDLQIPLDGFVDHWQKIQQGYDGVFGVRRKRDDPRLRLWLTGVIRQVIPLLFGVSIFDANVPYKLFKRNLWDEAKVYIPDSTLAPSLFLAVYLKRKGYRIYEVDIPHRERERGEVSIKRWKLFKFCLDAFRELWVYKGAIAHVK